LAAAGTFQFAGHTLDMARGSLQAGSREVELRPKTFEVLAFLVENAPRLVGKEELIQAVWPNVIVTDDVLTHCVSEIRSAIGDERQNIVKTVPRRGYRFAAPVSRLAADRAPALRSPSLTTPPARASAEADGRPSPPLPDRPSIAVLPFQNMSGDLEQEYFADGIVEEIITALSRFSGLFVIARNSTFTYKGRAVDITQIGRELGVRYVLEGSVRRAMHRVRITGQLIDAASGTHLWADRFDGALEDIFELQDNITSRVVGAIAPKMEWAEIERAKRKSTGSFDAYDYFLHGLESAHKAHHNRDAVDEALRLFSKATELDPAFAAAYGMAAYCYVLRQQSGWITDRKRHVAEAARLARKAVELGKDDAVALHRAGHALAYVAHEFDAGASFIDRALGISSNLASAWLSSACLRIWIGEPDTVIKHAAHFKRVSPLDPQMPLAQSVSGFAQMFAGRYEEALSQAHQVLQENPDFHPALRLSAAANALIGRLEQSRKSLIRLRQIDPVLRVSNLTDLTPLCRPQDLARYTEGMRKAGLPE
jgi:TolB-like protein